MPQPRGKQFYDKFSNCIMNKLGKHYPGIKFNKAGSRDKGNYRRESDLDLQFTLPQPVQREEVYPEMIEILKEECPQFNGERIEYTLGTDGNVIKIKPSRGGKIDLVLVKQFY